MSAVRFGSVCSGIEAASVAWEPLGWQAAWLSEIEPFPSAVLAHHYPRTPNLGDMTTIARRVLAGEVEAPEVLAGGCPCQAFSLAGLRESLADERGNLTLKFVELADAIDHVRGLAGQNHAVTFYENVQGILNTRDNAFGCLLAGLAGEDDPLQPAGKKWPDAGAVYGPRRAVAWRTLDAQYFGLAQRRRRVFVVASARPGFDPAAVLFEWQGVRRDTAPSRTPGEKVAPALDASFGRLRGISGQDVNNGQGHLVMTPPQALLGVIAQNGGDVQHGTGDTVGTLAAAQARYTSGDVLAFGGNNTSGPIDVATAVNACATASGRQDFETETFITQPAVAFKPSHYTRDKDGAPSDVCPPLTKEADKGNQDPVLHVGRQVRRLTPTECETLQGFPRNYTRVPAGIFKKRRITRLRPADMWEPLPDGRWLLMAADSPRYKALGNSWAVPVARWLGARINAALEAA